jgi:hypothetical protein
LQAQSVAQRKAYLQALGMSEQTARRLAIAQEQAALITTFRAGTVNLSWSADDGIEMAVDFHNFVVLRDGGAPVAAQAGSGTLTAAVRVVGGR